MVNRRSWLFLLALAYVYFIAAAAAFEGFYQKWGLLDGNTRAGFEVMYDQSGHRPFVYRQLLPRLADVAVQAMPDGLRSKLQAKAIAKPEYAKGGTTYGMYPGTADQPKYAIAYLIVYFLCFLSLFGGLFAGRAMLQNLGFSEIPSSVAPIIFILMFPAFETIGGYYYDCSEILFVFAFAAILQFRVGYLFAIPLALLATYNKESFPFFLIGSLPLLLHNHIDTKRIVTLCASVALSIAMHLVHAKQFALNPGGETEFHLLINLKFYVNPLHLLHYESLYRLPGPGGYNLLLIIFIISAMIYGRKYYSSAMRWYFLTIGMVGFTLFACFAFPGEMRNLSIMYPALLLFLAASLQRIQDGPDREKRMECAKGWDNIHHWLANFVPKKFVRFIPA